MDNSPDRAALAELRDGFVRQRRALVVTSLALVAFLGLGARLEELDFLGNSVKLTRPLAVTTPLWIAWAYFLLRYYQYFHDTTDTGFLSAVGTREGKYVRDAATKWVATHAQVDLTGFDKPHVIVAADRIEPLDAPPGQWRLQITGGIHVIEKGQGTRQAFQILDKFEVRLPFGVPRYARQRAIAWAIFHTRFGTEYGLPFGIAALPPIAAALVRLGLLHPAV